MRLLELRANKPDFKTVSFNPTGVSLIVGSKSNPVDKDPKKTYNGVGKSLIVALIHYCLGSKTKADFEKKIPDWQFELDFKIGNKFHSVSREVAQQKKLTLDNQVMIPKHFNTQMAADLFKIPTGIGYLSFRSLISRFIRPEKEAYGSCTKFMKDEFPFPRLINNGFLLGLDPHLIYRKMELKEQLDVLKASLKTLKDDPVIAEFFRQNSKNPQVEIRELREEVETLQNNISKFKIADDFDQKREKADQTKRKLRELHNRTVILQDALTNIDKSLQIQSDLPLERITDFYGQAGVFFSDRQLKSLREVKSFHSELKARRKERLQGQRKTFQIELKELRKNISERKAEYDALMAFLGDHGALQDYTNFNQELGTKQALLDKLEEYRDLLANYQKRIDSIKQTMLQENTHTIEFLNQNQDLLERNMTIFRNLSREFYKDKPGGIAVTNNEGQNKVRFDMDVTIQDDKSDGINEVKIFCFDWTLLQGGHNHCVKFLFHDSRIFSDMDPRQRATALRLARQLSEKQDYQYIASINEDMLLSTKDYLDPKDYDYLQSRIVLNLTDKSSSDKLLGMQINLDY